MFEIRPSFHRLPLHLWQNESGALVVGSSWPVVPLHLIIVSNRYGKVDGGLWLERKQYSLADLGIILRQ
jgi:hypothetical protein